MLCVALSVYSCVVFNIVLESALCSVLMSRSVVCIF